MIVVDIETARFEETDANPIAIRVFDPTPVVRPLMEPLPMGFEDRDQGLTEHAFVGALVLFAHLSDPDILIVPGCSVETPLHVDENVAGMWLGFRPSVFILVTEPPFVVVEARLTVAIHADDVTLFAKRKRKLVDQVVIGLARLIRVRTLPN